MVSADGDDVGHTCNCNCAVRVDCSQYQNHSSQTQQTCIICLDQQSGPQGKHCFEDILATIFLID